MKNKNLVIFDIDGVILDSKINMEYAWNEVRRLLKITTPFESYFKLIGRPFKDIIHQLSLLGRYDEIEKVYFDASKHAMSQALFYKNVTEVLMVLEKMGKTLAIATSKDEARTKIILDKLPVKFSQIQTPNNKMRGKPAPDHLLYILAILNFDPSEAVYIGDMPTDAEAARRANIDYINAEWGYGDKAEMHEYTASDITDIIKIL
jgi:phosphoglycolate phosphatase